MTLAFPFYTNNSGSQKSQKVHLSFLAYWLVQLIKAIGGYETDCDSAVIVQTNCSVQFCRCAAPATFVSPCWGVAMTFWSKACIYSISLPYTWCGPREGAWPSLMYVILPSNSPSLCAGVTWCCIRDCKLGHVFAQWDRGTILCCLTKSPCRVCAVCAVPNLFWRCTDNMGVPWPHKHHIRRWPCLGAPVLYRTLQWV